MRIERNTILITGGSSGIGLAMAEAFVAAGNDVLICGRREDKLAEAKQRIPQLHVRACDIAVHAEREELFRWATAQAPRANMLVNNAGIQRELDFANGTPDLFGAANEIETNLTAAIHLAALFLPHFRQLDDECAIVNVTSGLAFIPLHIVPVYCATKAALHSFSMSLRSQLATTNVRVFELIPPIVKTELHREAKARAQAERGIPPEKVARAALAALRKDRYEKSVGRAKDLQVASRLAAPLPPLAREAGDASTYTVTQRSAVH